MKRLYRFVIKYENKKETYEVYGSSKWNGYSNLLNYLERKGYNEEKIELVGGGWLKDKFEIMESKPINN